MPRIAFSGQKAMLDCFVPIIPVLERYLLSQEKQQFIESLDDPIQKDLINFLISPYTSVTCERIKQSNQNLLSIEAKQYLIENKILKFLRSQNHKELSQNQRKYLISQLKILFNPQNCKIQSQNQVNQTQNQINQNKNELNQRQQNNQILKKQLDPKQKQNKLNELIILPNLSQFYTKKLKQKSQNFNKFSQQIIFSLSEQQILSLSHDMIAKILKKHQIVHKLKFNILQKLIQSYETKMLQKNNNFNISQKVLFQNMTKNQLQFMIKKKPRLLLNQQIVSLWFNKTFHYQINVMKKIDHTKKEHLFKQLYLLNKIIQQLNAIEQPNSIQNLNPLQQLNTIQKINKKSKNILIQRIVNRLDYQRFWIQTQLDISKLERLTDFIVKYQINSNYLNQNYHKNSSSIKLLHITYLDHTCNLGSRVFTVVDLIDKYLNNLFKPSRDQIQQAVFIKQLSQYFNSKILHQIAIKSRLKKGQISQNLNFILEKNVFEQLQSTKFISICDNNKFIWSQQDDIILEVKIKRIKNIQIKVFQLNTQKYLLDTGSEMDENIDLSYYSPNISKNYKTQVNTNFHEVLQYIQLPIEKTFGIYIVELQGEDILSRAIIRRGSIIAIKSKYSEGYKINFINQRGQSLQTIKVWLDGRCTQITKGEYFIPFPAKTTTFKLICSIQQFSQIVLLTLEPQTYTFDVGYLYTPQSFIVGNIARIILHPYLKSLNNIDLNILQNVNVRVILTDHLDVPSIQNYSNIKFRNDEDFLVQFPVKTYLKNIQLHITAQIILKTGQKLKVNHQKSINISDSKKQGVFMDVFLTKLNQNTCKIQVLGLNGQPLSQKNVKISYNPLGFSQIIQKNDLITDQLGQIQLKNIKNINNCIKVQVQVLNEKNKKAVITKCWNLNEQSSQIKNNKNQWKQNFITGQIVKFNCSIKQNNKSISLVSVYQNNIFDNLDQQIQFRDDQIIIKGLQNGQYILFYHGLPSFSHKLFVKNCQKLTINNNIYFDKQKKQILQSNQDQIQLFKLGQMNINQISQSQIEVTIPIISEKKQKIDNLRSHIFLTNFSYSQFEGEFVQSNFKQKPNIIKHTLDIKKSVYKNNKRFSDEISYVFNREKQDSMMGNTFEKPKLFIKRIQAKYADLQNDQIIKSQKSFSARSMSEGSCEDDDSHDNKMMRSCIDMESDLQERQNEFKPQAQKRQKKQIHRNYYQPSNKLSSLLKKARKYSTSKIPSSSSEEDEDADFFKIQKQKISGSNNFLKQQSKVLANIKGKNISFILKKDHLFSEMKVYLISSCSCINRQYNLVKENQNNSTKNRTDLRNTKKEYHPEGMGWGLSRQVYTLKVGQSKNLSKNSQWRVVTTNDIINFASIKGVKFPQWFKDLHQWFKFSDQKKLQFYNDFYCHQLNCFAYFKDQGFFQKIIKPFISSKLNKSIIDLCLLEDETISKFADYSYLADMNQFQKVLLICCLKKKNNKILAQNILNYMKAKTLKVNNSASQQRYFDWIMSQTQLKNDNLHTNSLLQKQAIRTSTSTLNRNRQNLSTMRRTRQMRSSLNSTFNLLRKVDFKEVQVTKQYVQVNYDNQINCFFSNRKLVDCSPFWVQIAEHVLQSNILTQYMSQAFMHLNSKTSFMLAMCFLPLDSVAKFDLISKEQSIQIKANNSFLIYCKEKKLIPYKQKYAVLTTQRIIDPLDKFICENGINMQKPVDQIIKSRLYLLQTVVTNTFGGCLSLKVIIDVPQGSIPLESQQYTLTKVITLQAYTTKCFERLFYFPSSGQFEIYPSIVTFENEIISKSQTFSTLSVLNGPTPKTQLITFDDILKEGSKQDILMFLNKKNLHQIEMFSLQTIKNFFTDKHFFSKAIQILRSKGYVSMSIWEYSFMHQDIEAIKQYLNMLIKSKRQILSTNSNSLTLIQIPIFEYSPYNALRCHSNNSNGSSMGLIRNNQFKITYQKFIISICTQQLFKKTQYLIVLMYYLILQDRILEAKQILDRFIIEDKFKNQLQLDYIKCFLNMYLGQPNYSQARQIVSRYIDYPIKLWKDMFDQVRFTLEQYDRNTDQQIQAVCKTQNYQTLVRNDGGKLFINIPANTTVKIYFYSINLQLYFSQYPFVELKNSFSSIKQSKIQEIQMQSQPFLKTINRPAQLKDVYIEVYEKRFQNNKNLLPPKKISSFIWDHPQIQIKVNTNEGNFQVFVGGVRKSSCYCKIFASYKSGLVKFYRDGYTDVKGSFKYALAAIDQIDKFAICVITELGSKIIYTATPNMQNFYDNL